MRCLLALALVFGFASAAVTQDGLAATQKRAADALLEIHEAGRILHNDGDYSAGYRLYQGGLMATRRMLADRPDIQKLIADGMAAAERLPAADRRAFRLHELIETVRIELSKPLPKATEHLTIPPRTVGPGTKTDVKPSATVSEVKDGVVGRVVWQGAPVEGVEVTFVTLGKQHPRVFETTTGPQGVYAVPGLPGGKYVILITGGAKKLPERYATSTTSPLIFDVKAGGEKLDFILQ